MFIVKRNNFDNWELILRVLSEEIPEDDATFQSWLRENPENKKLYSELRGQIKTEAFDKDAAFTNISKRFSFKHKPQISIYKKCWFGYLAGMLFLIMLSIGLLYDKDSILEQFVSVQKEVSVFEPGAKIAYLLTPDRGSIDLSETFEIVKDDGTVISNDNEGIVCFEKKQHSHNKVEYHTLYVPKGGEYKLSLADGSKVFLNAETQLEFPSYFDGETREVRLTGEAYFEVQKDAKPFIVKTENIHIEVFGTSFNVNAYRNESTINTTLVSGSVQVHILNNAETYQLMPLHNLKIDKLTDQVSVHPVDTALYTAWVKGEFIFRNQSLKDIFSQLERWYDFTIVYDDPSIQLMRFTGSAEKTRPLNYLLSLIESVTDLKYKDDIGDKIILYK